MKSKAAAAKKKSDNAGAAAAARRAGFSHEAVRAGPRPEGGRRPQPRRGRASACTCVHVYAPWHKAYDRPTTHLPSVSYSRVKLVEGFQSPCQYGISSEAVNNCENNCGLLPPSPHALRTRHTNTWCLSTPHVVRHTNLLCTLIKSVHDDSHAAWLRPAPTPWLSRSHASPHMQQSQATIKGTKPACRQQGRPVPPATCQSQS